MISRRLSILILSIVILAFAGSQRVNAQIGTWKNYLAYSDITDVKRGGNCLYVLASNDLFVYNENDKSITTYDKVNGLSDNNITNIEWNDAVDKLIIVYSDYNIDLLDNSGNITNISGYYNSTLQADKTVYDVYMNGQYAYLSTGFGILKVDMSDALISDTYNLHMRVDYCYTDGSYFYAESSTNGLYRASVSDNLLDPNNWSRVGDYTAKSYTVDADLLAIAKSLSPGGPKNNNFGKLKFYNNKLYSVAGGFEYNTDHQYPGYIQIWDGSSWTIDGTEVDSITGRIFIDVSSIDIDPTDANHFFVSGRTGLYEFRNNQFVAEYTPENSPIQALASNPTNKNYTLVFGIKFDSEGNLWVTNSQSATTSILEYTKDGEWVDHHQESLMTASGYSLLWMNSLMFDSSDLLWFIDSHWSEPYVVCYQPSSGGLNLYTEFPNEDGTTIATEQIRYITEDLNGNIWICSDGGPFYISADSKTDSPQDMVFQQYKVPRNDGTNYADYLLSGVPITGMAVDGGNRKWFTTNGSGVYLISADNNTEVHHFTADDSGLLSDNVQSVAINPTTGEVFFATDQGLCSYMSDATATVDEMNKDVTYAYPNPVKPGYTGPITVTGLTYDADVKIVTSSGVLVAEGRSNGGTFVWDGTDLDGKRVASGVYMVETATQDGDSGTVCKIVIVN